MSSSALRLRSIVLRSVIDSGVQNPRHPKLTKMTTVETRKTLKFTKMCKHFSTQRCFMGNQCNFAHSEEELRSRPNLAATGLCYQFMSKGQCKRGESCTFAHGRKELREIPKDVKETREHEAVELRSKRPAPPVAAPVAAPGASSASLPLPLLPPLLPIDELLLSAGLAVSMRPPPGLPPPVPTAASLAASAMAQAAHAAALAAVSVLSTEQLKNLSFDPMSPTPTTASVTTNISEVGSEASAEFDDERLAESVLAPPGLERDCAIWF